MKNDIRILVDIALNLYIILDSMNILTMIILLLCGYETTVNNYISKNNQEKWIPLRSATI